MRCVVQDKTRYRSETIATRRFGTTDLVIVMALWSAMAVVLGGVLSEVTADSETPIARSQTETFGLRLLSEAAASSPAGLTRGPASLGQNPFTGSGELGRDPWGHPYKYRVFGGAVVVWSLGRNGVSDSDPAFEALGKDAVGQLGRFKFLGDDVGYLRQASGGTESGPRVRDQELLGERPARSRYNLARGSEKPKQRLSSRFSRLIAINAVSYKFSSRPLQNKPIQRPEGLCPSGFAGYRRST